MLLNFDAHSPCVGRVEEQLLNAAQLNFGGRPPDCK